MDKVLLEAEKKLLPKEKVWHDDTIEVGERN